YALGKAQRILTMVDTSIGPIYGHGAIENVNEVLRTQGVKLPETSKIELANKKGDFSKALIIATPSAINSTWVDRFKDHQSAIASGWMAIRGTRRRRNVDTGFVLSDHADWKGLLSAIKDTEATHIYTTHGYTDIFARYLNEVGYIAQVVKTEFGDEESQEG
nr:DNA ligase-associated DEXH box helicase [Saprospiraceae bacterium]